jgi:hypothetical protein
MRTRRWLVVLLLLSAVGVAVVWVAASRSFSEPRTAVTTVSAKSVAADSAAQVLRHIESVGAGQALHDYIDGPYWESILERVATGDDEWLEVRARLRRVSDAHASEALDDALFDALPVRPFRALTVMREENRMSTEELCTFTFEDECPSEGIEGFLAKLESALNKAQTPDETEARQDCLKGISATRVMFRDKPDYCSGSGVEHSTAR